MISQVHGGVLNLKHKKFSEGVPARVVDVTIRSNIALCTTKYLAFIDDSYVRTRRDEYCPRFPQFLNVP